MNKTIDHRPLTIDFLNPFPRKVFCYLGSIVYGLWSIVWFSVYAQVKEIEATLITDKKCSFCSTEAPREFLRRVFPDVTFKILHYEDKNAEEIIKEYGIDSLPCFVFPSGIKEEKNFGRITEFFEEKEGQLFSKQELAGVFLFLDRENVSGRLDFFLDLYDVDARSVFDDLVDFSQENDISLYVHFVIPEELKFGYPLDEIRIALAVKRIYPKKIFDYISRRLEGIKTIFWEDSLRKSGINYNKITKFIESRDMEGLTEENRNIVEELGVKGGNVIVVNNNRIFKVFAIDKEGLKGLFRK